MAIFTVIIFFFTLIGQGILHGTDVSVKTNVGEFIGFKKSVSIEGRTVLISKFLGIPYAEPPVGELRFKKPVARAVLKEPVMTKKHGPECVQMEFFQPESPTTEDCLYLNVYAPPTDADEEKLAVMIWIHGGGFVMGSANIYNADTLATHGNVIVVTINYRISVLGFLNVGDENSPGNYGLWDQHLALRWVHDNIGAFGGDNGRITIFGESSGAASGIFQGLYPGNKGLFHRIISQSGSVHSPWAYTKNYKEEAKEFAALVGCETNDKRTMVNCLRNTETDEISSALNDFSNGLLRVPFPLMPSIDQDFVKVSPDKIFSLNDDTVKEALSTFSTFDLLMGINEVEGSGYINPLVGIYDDPDIFLPNRTYFENVLVPIALKPLFGDDVPTVLKDLVIAEYTNWSDPENPMTIREQYIDLQGDINFLYPLQSTITAHASMSQRGSYMYQFSVDPSAHAVHTPKWVNRANHGDEIQFVFGGQIDFETWGSNVELTNWEKGISKSIMTLWTNFAKTGNPNKPRDIGLDWEPYTLTKHSYLEITRKLGPWSVKERFQERKANLWCNLLPALNNVVNHEMNLKNKGTCEKNDCSP